MANTMPSRKVSKRRKGRQRPLRRIDMSLRGFVGPCRPGHEMLTFRTRPGANIVNSNNEQFWGQNPSDDAGISQDVIRKAYVNEQLLAYSEYQKQIRVNKMQGFQQNSRSLPFRTKSLTNSNFLRNTRQKNRIVPIFAAHYLQPAPHVAYKPSREQIAEAVAETVNVVQKNYLEEIHRKFDEDFQQNLWDMEVGLDCPCNRHQWQHQLHPSGGA